MQTISINSTAFNDAKEYATSHNLSVDEFVVKLIYSFLHSQPKKKRFKMLPLEELSPEIQDIMSIPMIGKIDANDVNADEAKAEYYKEKYML